MQMFNFLTASAKWPGIEQLNQFTQDWTNIFTGKGDDVGKAMSQKNDVVNFYLTNEQYLKAGGHAMNNFTGTIQNGIYGLLNMLLNSVQGLIKAALLPLYYIPKMMMEQNNPLHIVFIAMLVLGLGLAGLSLGVSIHSYLTGKNDEIKSKFRNVTFNIATMILLPFIFAAGGQAVNSVMNKSGDLPNLSQSVLASNTVDLESWALHGFNQTPFSSGAPRYNNIEKSGIPNFTEGIDNDQVKFINKSIGKSKNANLYKDIGDTFKYEIQEVPVPDTNNPSDSSYVVKNMNLDKNIFNSLSNQYKRYHVQNFTAICSYLILIVVGFLMAIKISRSSIGIVGHLLSTPVMAGRDGSKSVEGIKGSIMEMFNGWLAIFIDYALLLLFVELAPTLPQQVADNFDNSVQQGIVKVFILAMIGFMSYTGSSVIERQFGFESGGNGQTGILRSLTSPGAMLAGSAGYHWGQHKVNKALRMEKVRQKEEAASKRLEGVTLTSDGGKRGKEAAELLSNMNRNKDNNSNNNGVSNTDGVSTSRNKANGSEQSQNKEQDSTNSSNDSGTNSSINIDNKNENDSNEINTTNDEIPQSENSQNIDKSNKKPINKSDEKKTINRGNFKDIDWGNTGSKSNSAGTDKSNTPETFNKPKPSKPINRGTFEGSGFKVSKNSDSNTSSNTVNDDNTTPQSQSNNDYAQLTQQRLDQMEEVQHQQSNKENIERLKSIKNQMKSEHKQYQRNRRGRFIQGLDQSSQEPHKPIKH